MKKTVYLLLAVLLLSTLPTTAQPRLRDLIGQGRMVRGDSDVERLIRFGGVLFELHQRRQMRRRSPQTFPPRRGSQTVPNYDGRPGGYDHIAVGGRSLRLDPTILPLTINPGESRYHAIMSEATAVWNTAGLGTFFALTNGPADLTIDWSGRAVSPGARAETRMSTSSRVVVPIGISVRSGRQSPAELARVMAHELGHVLGFDHSQDQNDLMYRSERRLPLALSARDRQMLTWLYSQRDYVPVIGATDQRSNPTSFALQPHSFCGCR